MSDPETRMVIHLNIIINIIFLYDFIYSDPENLVLIICFNYIGKKRSKYNMLLEKERQQQRHLVLIYYYLLIIPNVSKKKAIIIFVSPTTEKETTKNTGD